MNIIKQMAIFCMMILVFAIPVDGLIDVGGVPLVKVFGLLGFGLTIVLMLTGMPIKGDAFFYITAFCYIGWVILSYLWTAMPIDYVSAQTISSQQTIKGHLYLIVLIFILYQLVDDERDLSKLASAFLLGTTLLAFFLVKDYDPSGKEIRNELKLFDANETCVTLGSAIPLAIYLFQHIRQPILRWLPLLYFPIAIYAILSTGSRTGSIVMTIGFLGFLPVIWRSSWLVKLLALATLIISLLVIVNVMPAKTIQRILSVGSEISQGTLNERSVIWAKAIEVFPSSPVIGQGVGSFKRIINQYGINYTAHNSFVAVAIEQGAIGLLLYLSVILMALIYAWRLQSGTAMIVMSMVLIVVIGQLSLTLQERMSIWFIYMFSALSYYLQQQRILYWSRHDSDYLLYQDQ